MELFQRWTHYSTRILWRLAAILLLLLMTPAYALAQDSDTTPPQLVAFSFSPTAVDVTTGAQSVVITMRVTDDLAGIDSFPAWMDVTFRSLSGTQLQATLGFGSPYGFTRISGTPLDGIWQGATSFPQYIEAGEWSVMVSLRDAVGNNAYLEAPALQASGFDATLEVISIQDIAAPHLEAFSFSPIAIDVSTGAQVVTATLHLIDGLSGVSYIDVGFGGPGGAQTQRAYEPTRIAGSPLDGVWQATVTFPRYVESGGWTAFVHLGDEVGNSVFLAAADLQALGFPRDLSVTSVPSDTSPPQLVDLDFSPTLVNTSAGPQPVTVTMHVTDDLAGVDSFPSYLNIRFRSPSGSQVQDAFDWGPMGFTRTAGTPQDGIFEATTTFPQYSEAGTWRVEHIMFRDAVGNEDYSLDTTALQNMGFNTRLIVIQPSQIIDGIISSPDSGGTVADTVYGDRAQISFPPGVLCNPTCQVTDVEIDVFESPLDIPMPSGFAAPGTRFVNIALDPAPPQPFPAPGVTVVLPLADAMAPGTTLDLFRVDPDTGDLVTSIGVNELPVVGTVNPDGLSATFSGIARLSIVVGLVPLSSGASLIVTPDSTEVYPGDMLNVSLDIQNANDLYAMQTSCTADPAVLQVQSGEFGGLFNSGSRFVAENAVVGGAWNGAVSLLSPAGPFSGSGNYAILTYEAVSPGTAAITCTGMLSDQEGDELAASYAGAGVAVLSFARISGVATYQGRSTHAGIDVTAAGPVTGSGTTDAGGAYLIDELEAGTYSVEADAPLYLPNCTAATLTAGQTLSLAATRLRAGDANDDDVINIGDAALVAANFRLTVPPADPRADINGDGVVNIRDLALLGSNYERSGCQAW